MPKVSVIVPCYNVAPYVGACLDSILSQSLRDIEIICVNDKSPDNTLDVLTEYVQKDSRIKIINQPTNMGVAVARNTAMDMATGDFISFIDADDMLPDEDVLADMYNAAIKHDVKICGGSVIMWNPNTDTEESNGTALTRFSADGIVRYADWANDYGFTRFIYDRKWLIENKIYFPKYIRQEDPVFFVRAMCLAGKFYALKRPTYKYRISYKSINWTNQTIKDVFCGLRDCLNIAREYKMHDLYLNVAAHTNHFIAGIRAIDRKTAIREICDVIEMLADYAPNDFVPDKFFLDIVKFHRYHVYDKYAHEMIASKRIYLFDLIPICRIKTTRLFTYVQLLDLVPLLRIRRDSRATRYYLFNLIPLLKIKG
ncbi:MAG: glycosyltransferase family 2 protein [Alphaproteobacteria bacterium]|nr:glycosyltransferase family 2 protein [Alphaproteobacteria bacterium]